MIRLAVIGTNWISHRFMSAIKDEGRMTPVAIYSRSMESANRFASSYTDNLTCYDDLELFLCSDGFDAVYIASPNACHFQQAKRLLQAGKHVMCEKPLASNFFEVKKLFEVAKENNVVLFEAFMTHYLPNFQYLPQWLLRIGTLRRVVLNFCQLSSRWPQYLAGEQPNAFNVAFSSGSIMDIGYYCVSSAVALFGLPLNIYAIATKLESGLDLQGSCHLQYEGFDVLISHSKVSQSWLSSEFQGSDGTLVIGNVSHCSPVEFISIDGQREPLSLLQHDNPMMYEVKHFVDRVLLGEMDPKDTALAIQTASVLTNIRRQCGIIFPADCMK